MKETLRRCTRQRGSAMIEFAVVGPIVTLLGLAVLQYGLLFFAKNQMNHAAFMAARAGSMGNANLDNIKEAYRRALIPLYGGGLDESELAASYRTVLSATETAAGCAGGKLCIEVLNPTKESFDDFNDAALEQKYGKRAIPNGGQAYKSPTDIRSKSGQNIQDANLIKLRITHGYPCAWGRATPEIPPQARRSDVRLGHRTRRQGDWLFASLRHARRRFQGGANRGRQSSRTRLVRRARWTSSADRLLATGLRPTCGGDGNCAQRYRHARSHDPPLATLK